MVIAIDIRLLMHGEFSGVEVYTLNLIRELIRLGGHEYILYYNTWKKPKFLETFEGISTVGTKIPNFLFLLTSRFFGWPKIDRLIEKKVGKRIDLLFLPDLRPFSVSKPVKTIMTIHDLSHTRFKHFFSWKTRLHHFLMKPAVMAKRADRLIAVSQFTASEIQRFWKIPPERVSVIYEGPGSIDETGEVGSEKPGAKYFLTISQIEPRKNLHELIRAFQLFRERAKSDIELVIAGKENRGIFRSYRLPNVDGVKRLGFVSEQEKSKLLRNAAAFFYLSEYEGFGLPILEAFQHDIPVVCANLSSLPEVAGDGAIYVNPHNGHEIADAMEKVLQPEMAEKLRLCAQAQLQKFSWKKAANELKHIFETARSDLSR